MTPLWFGLIFVTVVGACVGSFLNVVIYRLPEGRSIVNPPSSCPKCGYRLAWRDNVPVLGWLVLLGRCRYCGERISIQYPLVEAATAALFGGWFYVCYLSGLRPDFAGPGVEATWLIMAAGLVLLAVLLAATLIDARFYIIPLGLPWAATAVAVVLLPLAMWANPEARRWVELPPVFVEARLLDAEARLEAVGEPYRDAAAVRLAVRAGEVGAVEVSAAPLVSWRVAMTAFGAAGGLLVAVVLLWLRILPLSFADEAHDQPKDEDATGLPPPPTGAPPRDAHVEGPAPQAPEVPPAAPGEGEGERAETQRAAPAHTERATPGDAEAEGREPGAAEAERRAEGEGEAEAAEPGDPHDWLAHPHPRREVLKECLFLALPVIGAVIGFIVAGPEAVPEDEAGLVLAVRALGGAVLGYLVGGGIVWATRVAGTLGFGKEAMGLGDVHLMAAVGAVAGWAVAAAAFFVAPFFGLVWAILSAGAAKLLRRQVRMIPYGPHLAVATVLVMVVREPLMTYVGMLLLGG